LAGILPTGRYSELFRNDLQSEAMLIVANCRRLAADWRGSAAGLNAARGHLERGTGEPAREARLLSIQASLASDTGHLEEALALLARASTIYAKSQDSAAVATVTVKEASSLLAAYRHEEAIRRAEEALRFLTPREARLKMLARSIITESLVFLGRPTEALRSLLATQPLYDQFSGRRTQLMVGYLEARLLDCMGYSQEAEELYRAVITGYMETEQYKEAFRIMLTHLESLFRRGALDKAARFCEEALEILEEAGTDCHSQMKEVWRDLLTLVNARRLTEHQVLAARHYLVRYGNAPAHRALPEWPRGDTAASTGVSELPNLEITATPVAESPAPFGTGESSGPAPENDERRVLAPEPPALPTRFAEGEYEKALERYERQLLAAALAQCHGRVGETSRLLRISRTTLRKKMREYGLAGKV
jgi:tetratricopeptide (TPR) repeat protein